jgi:CheY-like chemotaxis protein
MSDPVIAGCRVLIVEDESIFAMMLEALLKDLGCQVVATVARPAEALPAIEANAIDVAVLDINLDGQTSYDVAAALAARGVPFIFSTGYSKAGARPEFSDRPMLHKPFRTAELEQALVHALRRKDLL